MNIALYIGKHTDGFYYIVIRDLATLKETKLAKTANVTISYKLFEVAKQRLIADPSVHIEYISDIVMPIS